MKNNSKIKLQLLIQNWFFVLLFAILVVLFGYLSNQFVLTKDVTQANRNTLTQGSIEVLGNMPNPINLTVFATKDDLNNGDTFRQWIINFMSRYQRTKSDINIKFISPVEEPKIAQEMGIQGRVYVNFIISKDGSITNIRMRGPDKNLENEAARIIGRLPKMTPGKQRGRAVRVPFSIPITFRLQ